MATFLFTCELTSLYLSSMPLSVAESAQGNQVGYCIAAELASGLQMMNMQILEGAALLASSTISSAPSPSH